MKDLKEIWKAVPQYAELEASDQGRIRKGSRILAQHWHNAPGAKYLRVQYHTNGEVLWLRVNRLVCAAFNGYRSAAVHARHLDGNSANNSAANLAWGSAADNFADQVRHGRANHPPLSDKQKADRARDVAKAQEAADHELLKAVMGKNRAKAFRSLNASDQRRVKMLYKTMMYRRKKDMGDA